MKPQEIEQLRTTHEALNNLTALFAASQGYDYILIEKALDVLRENHRLYGFPLTVAFLLPEEDQD